MTVILKLFGPQVKLAGTRELMLEIPANGTCGDLRRKLKDRVPAIGKSLASSRFAVNSSFVDDAAVIHEGDEVALIGMVSGG